MFAVISRRRNQSVGFLFGQFKTVCDATTVRLSITLDDGKRSPETNRFGNETKNLARKSQKLTRAPPREGLSVDTKICVKISNARQTVVSRHQEENRPYCFTCTVRGRFNELKIRNLPGGPARNDDYEKFDFIGDLKPVRAETREKKPLKCTCVNDLKQII